MLGFGFRTLCVGLGYYKTHRLGDSMNAPVNSTRRLAFGEAAHMIVLSNFCLRSGSPWRSEQAWSILIFLIIIIIIF